jgi:hypothetical protein
MSVALQAQCPVWSSARGAPGRSSVGSLSARSETLASAKQVSARQRLDTEIQREANDGSSFYLPFTSHWTENSKHIFPEIRGQNKSVLRITRPRSFIYENTVHQSEPDIYFGLSLALHLKCKVCLVYVDFLIEQLWTEKRQRSFVLWKEKFSQM